MADIRGQIRGISVYLMRDEINYTQRINHGSHYFEFKLTPYNPLGNARRLIMMEWLASLRSTSSICLASSARFFPLPPSHANDDGEICAPCNGAVTLQAAADFAWYDSTGVVGRENKRKTNDRLGKTAVSAKENNSRPVLRSNLVAFINLRNSSHARARARKL